MTTPDFEQLFGPSGPCGWRVKETATHYIDVVQMIYNWRIVTTPKDSPESYDRGWCFEGRDVLPPLIAALAWDPETEPEPTGWVKEVHTGRRRPGGDASQEYIQR